MKTYIYLIFTCICFNSFGQERKLEIDFEAIKSSLKVAKLEKAIRASNNTNDERPIIKLPLIDGTLKAFYFMESPIWEKVEDMAKAEIQTYSGVSVDNDGFLARITISSLGLSAIIRSPSAYYIIEVEDLPNNKYIIYPLGSKRNIKCEVGENSLIKNVESKFKLSNQLSSAPFPNGTYLRVYRFAAAATGEFTTNIGSGSRTTALQRITEIVNLISLIYESEVAIRFSLVAETTNKNLIFSDASTDPFSPSGSASADASQNGFNLMSSNQGSFANFLPYVNYDIGHTFHFVSGSSGSGQAGPTPCTNSYKARGWTQMGLNYSTGIVANIAAHEIGHQFEAHHTFNARGGTSSEPTVCSDQWDGTSAVEPGGGVTLMGYGQVCSSPNYTLTGKVDNSFFHTKSIEQILQSDGFGAAGANGCANLIATGNSLPVANAGPDVVMPVNTPFTLTGSATDNDNTDVLTYTWEEYDIATLDDKGALGATVTGRGGYSAVNSPNTAPLFRSYIPSITGYTRTFPDMQYVLNNVNNGSPNSGEDLPQVGRIMKFRLTVRDNKVNGGGIDSDERIINVDASKGPFTLTSPNGGNVLNAGSSLIITWQVNGTDVLSSNVKILLSIDGGNSFPIILVANTPNDNNEIVTVPNNVASSTTCRIKIVSLNDTTFEFFDVSDSNFTISSSCLANNSYICPTNTISEQSGNAIFNLGLNYYPANKIIGGKKVYSTSGSVNRTLFLYTNNSYTTCTNAGFQVNSILISFRVSKPGVYNISALTNTASSRSFTVYSSTSLSCNTFIGSNSYDAGGGSYSRITSRDIFLNECIDYYIVVYLGSSSTPTIDLSIIGDGDVIEVSSNPQGVNYTYVAVNQSNSQIAAVSSNSDFTSLSQGNYKIYGLEYQNTINPTIFLNQTISQVYNSNNCILFSTNSKTITVLESPCLTNILLISPNNNIGTGTQLIQASATALNAGITASNKITGTGTRAIFQAKTLLLQSGFEVNAGSIFRAEVGGCN
ncbi:hypothetical protein Emtol_3382 [Emticicia oligotrophica DSM 17448]|uniref:Peptidase M12B domain-containing protein n=1 Tax=Emticicia oligotrophica (strain DSM 17448 / CIP 109782 / MTCC 6937 / GPTSA100-15) TaxID=929562 RepID=A0ABM5N4V7_EMTOG|nr:M12 family metallo-peptidase [Emticicia oligotrophica]AFK04511.1 hypothetical protein Emtol_3382 [Emticicia oligotrophica DSM 17448]